MWRKEITRCAVMSVRRCKVTNWPGATPFGRPLARPNARSGFGVAPGQFCCSELRNPRTTDLPLLHPQKPKISKHQYYAKIDELLAITMEKYSKFIEANSIDQVIAPVLGFVFWKDTDFK